MSFTHIAWDHGYHITLDELIVRKKEPECCICEDLDDKYKNFAILTCGHVFHISCLSRWYDCVLSKSYSKMQECPYCRQKSSFVKRMMPSTVYMRRHRDIATYSGQLWRRPKLT